MKKLLITAIAVLLLLAGCKKGIAPLKAGVLTEPVRENVSAQAKVYIDALDYAVKDFVNRAENKGITLKYISCDLSSGDFLTETDRQDVEKFLNGYGIPFDGSGRERSIEEQQQGLELTVVENPDTEFYGEGAEIVLQVKAFIGPAGRGYFGSFQSKGKGYVMTYVYDNVVYTR